MEGYPNGPRWKSPDDAGEIGIFHVGSLRLTGSNSIMCGTAITNYVRIASQSAATQDCRQDE